MIAVGRHFGAEIFATVRSPQKMEALVQLGVAPDHILSSNSVGFVSLLRDATKGRGVDVVVGALVGETLRATLDCMAPFGRFVNLHLKEASNNRSVEVDLPANVSYASVDIPVKIIQFLHSKEQS